MIQNPMLFYWTNVQHGKIIWPHYLKSQTLFTYNLVKLPFLLGLFHMKYINIYFKLLNYYYLYLIFVNTWLIIIIIAGPLLTTLTETWAFVFVCVSTLNWCSVSVSLILSKVLRRMKPGKCVSSQNHNLTCSDSTFDIFRIWLEAVSQKPDHGQIQQHSGSSR